MSKGSPVCSPSCLRACISLVSQRRAQRKKMWGSRGWGRGEGRGGGEEGCRGSCPVRSARSCLHLHLHLPPSILSSTAPPVEKRALSGERIHFSVETPHTQSSESCSYATSRYLLPVSPINYSPKYRSQGKETPRMGRRDTAALSQLNGRGQIKKEWVVGG